MIVYHDNGKDPIFRDLFAASGVNSVTLYRNIAVRFIHRKLRFYAPKSLVYSIPKPLENDNKIIVFDTFVTPKYLQWLCSQYPDKRILLWYWNPAPDNRFFDLFPRRVEIWSYSPEDCMKYGFRYNTQFFFDCLASESGKPSDPHMPDTINKHPLVLFLGRDKGRKKDILEIRSVLEQNGADTEFYFLQGRTKEALFRRTVIPYKEAAEKARNCDVILDYSLSATTGLTLRPLEALFFRKKLITNNKDIAQYDFYRKENIYILGEENRTLREFWTEPYVEVDKEIRDYYLLSNWLKRFDFPENGTV